MSEYTHRESRISKSEYLAGAFIIPDAEVFYSHDARDGMDVPSRPKSHMSSDNSAPSGLANTMNEMTTCPICEEQFSAMWPQTRPFCSDRCREECMGDGNTCITNAWLEDGNSPPDDPDRWDNCVRNFFPGTPCPDCGTDIRMILGPVDMLEPYVRVVMETCPETMGFEHPVYLYCDGSRCDWHDVDEWERIRAELERIV